jgi:Zn-dependent M28 family amino/carboxypeptidase
MPKNCRIIDLNCGSEEVGLRGSMAFAKEHKNDDLLKNAWNINIDSVADKDYFEVVIKDDWQMCRFDKDLEQMFKDTFTELGIESKTNGCIHNPVGGCDSTPMTRAGIKSVTFAAQNPMLTYYYHTFRDTADRFEPETVGLGFEIVLGVIEKIAAFQEQNGFNGVNN